MKSMARFKCKAQTKKNSFLNIPNYLTGPKQSNQILHEGGLFFPQSVAPVIKCMGKAAFLGQI